MEATRTELGGGRAFYAHTREGAPDSEWERLEDHLTRVGERAGEFASAFGAADWGRLAGLWHDLGKYSTAFQDYLRSSADSHQADLVGKVDHSTAGAQHSTATIDLLGHLLAYVIAGHHSGLLDGISEGACLDARLKKRIEPWRHGLAMLPTVATPGPPAFLGAALAQKDDFAVGFFVRMLFSCLVDADFMETERFLDSTRSASRPKWPTNILLRMSSALDEHVAELDGGQSVVNLQRAAVRSASIEAALNRPGLFSLTVPTGGGKTLSSLAFALRHAMQHGLHRIVYVVPFTTIIEQNADCFRRALARLIQAGIPDPIIEHHSNLDVGKETIESRLASENWDAPLIVTTSVQFYESLFASRTSRCRKLHNLAGSVIVLDEAQTLPVPYLSPCLRTLRELTTNYGASVVLCTATQPAIHRREGFSIGLEGVREIIPKPTELYRRLRRVDVSDVGKLDDATLATRLLEERNVLCIVNTRNHALKLFDALGRQNGHFHLSALMCPAHRTRVLETIRNRLRANETTRVVSTQLIEAGVDIDFAVVYRSLAGLDAIAQAAGRCNRNGTLPERGRTYIFRSEHTRSEVYFKDTANCAEQLLPSHAADPLGLDAIERYFHLYYWDQSSRWDEKQILDAFHLVQDRELPFLFKFAEVAENFQLIEDTGKPVIVPWDENARNWCERLRRTDSPAEVMLRLRQLQRYVVQVHSRVYDQELNRSIELIDNRYAVLISLELNYSDQTGVTFANQTPPLLLA